MPETYLTISGIDKPSDMISKWNTNITALETDITELENKTASISGDGVGTIGYQTLADKVMVSEHINNNQTVANNHFTFHRHDFNSSTELMQVHTYHDETNTGVISNILPGGASNWTAYGSGLGNDSKAIYALVISGGNGVRPFVSNNELHIEMETNTVFNANGQTFAFGSTGPKSGFDFDVNGLALFRNSLVISDEASPSAGNDGEFIIKSNAGFAKTLLKAANSQKASMQLFNVNTKKFSITKDNNDDFYIHDTDKSNYAFVIDNSNSGHVAINNNTTAADPTYPFWVNSNSKITGNLDVSGDITTGTFKGTLYDDTVTTTSITDAHVTLAKMDTDSVDTNQLVDDSVTSAKLEASVASDGITFTDGVLTPNVDGSTLYVNSTQIKIKPDGILTTHIAADQVTEPKIGSQAVTKTQIHTNVAGTGLTGGNGTALAVGVDNTTIEHSGDNLKIKAGGVDSAQIKNGSIDAAHFATGAIDNAAIGAGEIDTSEIADLAVTNGKIANGTINASKLAGSIGGDKLSSTISGNKTFSGTVNFTGSEVNINGNELQPGAQCPIGTILAWAKGYSGVPANLNNNAYHSMPSNAWKECNGGNLNDAASPMDNLPLPNLNGSGDSTRRFLRGSSASSAGGTGGTVNHAHGFASSNKGDRNGSPRWANNATNSQNHIPPYFEVKYIIRVK